MLLDCNSPSTAQPLAQQGAGAIVSGYVLLEAIENYIAHLRLCRSNVARWVKQKEKMLLDFRAWASVRSIDTLESIQARHLDAYLETRATAGEKPSTLHKKAIVIRHLTRWALDRGHVVAAPLAHLKLEAECYAVPELPDFKEFMRLIQEEKNTDRRDFFTVAALTGLRRGELFAVRWQDVFLEEGYIHIRCTATWKTKNKRSRTVPICAKTRAILEARKTREKLGGGPFMRTDGKPTPDPNRTSAAWRAITRGAKLDLRMHTLRHAFCTHILQDLKADPVSAQTVMGHTTMRTTQLYMHPNPDTPKRIGKLLDKSPALRD